MPISSETARDIAFAYREVNTATELLAKIKEAGRDIPDIRDAFGRQKGLQLGVPSGESSYRLYDVPWSMCKPILEAHIAQQRAIISALSEKALIEAEAPQ